jgi:hypothetical protein
MSVMGASVVSTEAALGAKTAGLGDRYVAQDGKEWVYIQASGAITGAGYVVIIDEAYDAAQITTSNDALGDKIGVANCAFADNDYGWVQIYGPCLIRVSASCAANAPLNTTATAGQLDDDATAGALVIAGAVLTTARAASAGTAAGILTYPYVVNDAVASLAAAGVTASAAELNYNDITTLGTGAASKAVVLDAGEDYTWPATGVLTYGVLKDPAGTALGATVAEINNAADVSARVQALTASGAITAGVQSVELNHATVVIAATVASSVNHPGLFIIKDTSATGTAAHTVTLTAGTFNGTATVATLDARDEMLVVYFDSAGRGQIIVNVGAVGLS